MSEHDPLPNEPAPPEFPAEPVAAPAVSAPARRRSSNATLWMVFSAIVAVLLAGGETFLFRAQSGLQDQSRRITTLESRVDALRSRVTALDRRLKILAARPLPKPPAPKVTVEQKIPAALTAKLDAMQANVAALSTTSVTDHAAVATLQSNAASLSKLTAKAQALARIAQASLALQNGEALGPIPNAPAALARFATKKPPTLGALKSSFPTYADKAARAGGAVAADGGFWRKLRIRAESLVTVRHGAKVLVGSRAEGVLAVARRDLDDDDLAAAVAALKTLPPAARSAMAPWMKKAARLLAARAALARMAEQK